MPVTSLTSFSPLPPPPPPPPAAPPPPEPPAAAAPPASPPPPPPPVAAAKPEPTPPAPVPARAPAPPPPAPEPIPELIPDAEPAAAGPNIFVAAARGWAWVLLGVAAGVVLGLLYHVQRPPVYQSRAELLVIKNRVELATPSGTTDARVAYLEDYVATQFRLIKSTQILQLAARQIKEKGNPPAGFPPADERAQVAFLANRLDVTREREPGSNTLSNTLSLTFRAADPVDSKRCLQAIIEAYEAELGTVYERASGNRLKTLDKEIDQLRNEKSKIDKDRLTNERQLSGISQERLDNIRSRISILRTQEIELKLKREQVNRDLEQITKTGPGRQERLRVMDQLGVKPDRPQNGGVLDSRAPEDVLFALEQEKLDRGVRLGAEHPEMVALDSRIKRLKELIAQQNAGLKPGDRPPDELDRHRSKLENDLASLDTQIQVLGHVIELNDDKATRMSGFQFEVDRLLAAGRLVDEKLTEKQRERAQVAATQQSGGYEVQAITPPSEGVQVAPILYQSLLLGAVLGLLLGGGLALAVEMSDRSFRTAAEIRRRLGVPVLGHIPRIRTETPPAKPSATGLDPLLTCFLRPNSAEAEAVRGIRTQLYFSTQGRGSQVIQVTSPTPGDGKSTLAANLAVSIAQSGKRVVLLDCDFRKPRVHRLFNITHPEVGLASVMAGDARLRDAVRGCEVENLFVMPCGPRPANPAELLTSPKFQELLAELKGEYDFVVVDSPPVLVVSDPVAIAPRVDGVLMVFRMTKSTRPNAERTREQLAAVGARILGVVVNASADRTGGYGGYGYTYQYNHYYTESYTAAEEPAALPKKG